MKATRIFPSAPSCASGGIGAEQKQMFICINQIWTRKRPDLLADKGLARPSTFFSVLQLLLVIYLFRALFPCHLRVQMSGARHGHVLRQHGILPQFSHRESQAASLDILKTID